MGNIKELYIEITHTCLLNCVHCSSEAHIKSTNFIPAAHIYRLIDEVLLHGLERLCLSGGEPLLHPDCMDIIKYAKDRNLEVFIYTCGILSNNDKLLSLPQILFDSLTNLTVDKLIFSLHGAFRGTHDNITCTAGSYDLVMESISRSTLSTIDTEVHFVPTKLNYLEIPELVVKLREIGIYKISFLRFVPQGRGKGNAKELSLSAKEGLSIVHMVDQLLKQYPDMILRLGSPFNCVNLNRSTPCSAAQNKLLISATGEVFPCEAFKHLKGSMFNIYDHSLIYIWENDLLLNLLRHLSPQDISGCSDCQLINQCKGGCPGERMLFNKTVIEGPEAWCLRS